MGRLHTLPGAGGSVGLGRSHPPSTPESPPGARSPGASFGVSGLPRPYTFARVSVPPDLALCIPYIITLHLSRAACCGWLGGEGECGVGWVIRARVRLAGGAGTDGTLGVLGPPAPLDLATLGGPLGLRACLGPQCTALRTPRSQRHTFGFECLPSLVDVYIYLLLVLVQVIIRMK